MMPDAPIFGQLSAFFDGLPDTVRAEISLVIVALAGDAFIDLDEEFDYEAAARGLFNAQTQLHRLGNLINAVGVLDVYFAGDPRKRFGTLLERYKELCKQRNESTLKAARDQCAERIAAIEKSRAEWTDLRETVLTATTLNAALMPEHDTLPSVITRRMTDDLGHQSRRDHVA
jgi:hypothetical protein